MRYWDASALVPLLVNEPATSRLRRLAEEDDRLLTWWGSRVECASALSRIGREIRIDAEAMRSALGALDDLVKSWNEIEPSGELRRTALRLLRVHSLRAADALQLAAALVAADGDPAQLPFVCRDKRLAEAADKEGFPVLE